MKSIKRGRAPSMMGGVMSLLIGLFGVAWTIVALRIGGGFMAVFGLIFVAVAVIQAIYHFRNATGKNRYSEYDITDGQEEPDPLNERFDGAPVAGGPSGPSASAPSASAPSGSLFCPYCGAPVDVNFAFCNRCGKRLPD